MKSNPYGAAFVDDSWKISSQFTLELGLRWDYWFAKSLIRGAGGTFDPAIGKAVAGLDNNGQVDLTAQPVAPFLAAVDGGSLGSRVTGPRSGRPLPTFGLCFPPAGRRLAAVEERRPGGSRRVRNLHQQLPRQYHRVANHIATLLDLRIPILESRAAPEMGNRLASESEFVRCAIGRGRRLQRKADEGPRMESLHSEDAAFQNGRHCVVCRELGRRSDWPKLSERSAAGIVHESPGGQAVPGIWQYRFIPEHRAQLVQLGSVEGGTEVLQRLSPSYWPMRFPRPCRKTERTLSTAYRRRSPRTAITADAPPTITPIFCPVTSFGIFLLGGDMRFGASMNPVANAVVGGWELSGIYLFSSGRSAHLQRARRHPGQRLGYASNVVGDPSLSNPSADLWFNPNAFTAPGPYLFGSSGIGILDGPSSHVVNLGLMKKFSFGEKRYLQFRWEAFNALNHVNLLAFQNGSPTLNTTIGQSSTGQITAAGDARIMQIALKLVF